jgi:hypothetical protein
MRVLAAWSFLSKSPANTQNMIVIFLTDRYVHAVMFWKGTSVQEGAGSIIALLLFCNLTLRFPMLSCGQGFIG